MKPKDQISAIDRIEVEDVYMFNLRNRAKKDLKSFNKRDQYDALKQLYLKYLPPERSEKLKERPDLLKAPIPAIELFFDGFSPGKPVRNKKRSKLPRDPTIPLEELYNTPRHKEGREQQEEEWKKWTKNLT